MGNVCVSCKTPRVHVIETGLKKDPHLPTNKANKANKAILYHDECVDGDHACKFENIDL